MSNPIDCVDRTWNPIVMRCTPCSEGCTNCWHLSMARRMANNPNIPTDQRVAYAGGTPVMTHRINDPLHWRKPQRIAVQPMGDLFHESIPFRFIDRIYEVMATSTRHTYLLLTKRPMRMAEYFAGVARLTENPNILPGISISNQPEADRLIPILLQIPAAKRWVSYEPALGPVQIPLGQWADCPEHGKINFVDEDGCCLSCGADAMHYGLDWVIVGGETGPSARPVHPEWVRSVRDQCRSAGVKLWIKSMGKDKAIPEDLMIREAI